jgi:5-formyltetrahydrofolate cyclo-ligase
MLFTLGLVNRRTPCVAIVHDCQVLDEILTPEAFDNVRDFVVTLNKTIEVRERYAVQKPTCGILWELLQPGMLEDIPPLKDLQGMGLNSSSTLANNFRSREHPEQFPNTF